MNEKSLKAQPKEKLFERFPDRKIPDYWRTEEFANLLGCSVTTVFNMCDDYNISYYRYPGKRTVDEPTKQAIILRLDMEEKLKDERIGIDLFKKYGVLKTVFLNVCIEKYPSLLLSQSAESNDDEHQNKFLPEFNLTSDSKYFASHVKQKLEQLVKKRTRKYRVDTVPHSIDELIREIRTKRPAFMEAIKDDEALREVVELVDIYSLSDFERICDMCRRIELELEPSNIKDGV